MKSNWRSGSKVNVSYNEILSILKKVSKNKGHKIIVGSDSVKLGEYFVFTNAICILNKNGEYDCRYFYLKEKIFDDKFYDLSSRLIKETSDSIDIAINLREIIHNANIEIHADVNNDIRHKSGKLKNYVIGYISGCGFDYKIKPDSFVASGIADNHTRKA